MRDRLRPGTVDPVRAPVLLILLKTLVEVFWDPAIGRTTGTAAKNPVSTAEKPAFPPIDRVGRGADIG